MSQPEFTPEEIAQAKAYTQHVIHEIEQVVIGEIEKIEGRVPTNLEISQHGVQQINPTTLDVRYFWRGHLLLEAKPHQTDTEGRRGTKLIIHQTTTPKLLP